MRKFLSIVLLSFFLNCNNTNEQIVGSWIQPVPGQAGKTQGIAFKADGTASSINMHTLKYENWARNKDGSKIILTGESIGNGQTIIFRDSLIVQKLTRDSLVLRKGKINLRYSRLKVEDEHYKMKKLH